jgi:hypothetical protein
MPTPARKQTADRHTANRQTPDEWLDSLDADPASFRDGRHLRAIGAALTAREAAERQLEDAIADARAAGDSWQAIGVVLGTSKQAAHRKFARR